MNNHKLFEQWAKVVWGRDAWRHTSPTSGEWDAWQAGVMSERSRIKQMSDERIDAIPFMFNLAFGEADGQDEEEMAVALRKFARAVLAAQEQKI